MRWSNVAGGEVPEFRGVPYVTTYVQTENTKKDYSKAAWKKVLIPAAQAK